MWRSGGTAGVEADLVQEHDPGLDPAPLADSKITLNIWRLSLFTGLNVNLYALITLTLY